jgi:hypothetical protein
LIFARSSIEEEAEAPTFRASAATAAATVLAKPPGAAAGDLVLVIAPDADGVTLTTSLDTAWTRDQIVVAAHGYRTVLFVRELAAIDVSNSWLLSGAEDAVAVALVGNDTGGFQIRSPTANGTGQSTLTLTGFTPAGTLACIAICVDRDNAGTPDPPTGFTLVYQGVVANWVVSVAINPDYVGGNVVWTDMSAVFAESGWLVEVKEP